MSPSRRPGFLKRCGNRSLRLDRSVQTGTRAKLARPGGGIASDALERRNEVVAEDCDVGKVSVALAEVQAVADHETVRDLEADVAHGHVDLAAGRLPHQGTDLE